jgi:hypothetical protein
MGIYFGGVVFDKTLTTIVTDVLFVVAPKNDPKWRLLHVTYSALTLANSWIRLSNSLTCKCRFRHCIGGHYPFDTNDALFSLVRRSLQVRKRLKYFYKVCTVYMAVRVCWLAKETRVLLTHSSKHV